NYPNPFNPSTKIKFELPATSKVSLKVFNILGEFVSELVNQTLETGSYEYQFNPKGLTSGVYFYKLEVQGVDGNNHFIDVKKMILMK
ncbi:MAG: T9SS type A sorting domain-containing protein, partial [Ignavibacteriaceae bacterium]|nr:T9SS type A sorting domain-containing protein [Ignavibacteriaceae bacterium]